MSTVVLGSEGGGGVPQRASQAFQAEGWACGDGQGYPRCARGVPGVLGRGVGPQWWSGCFRHAGGASGVPDQGAGPWLGSGHPHFIISLVLSLWHISLSPLCITVSEYYD